jgi:hypothetical protein
MDPILLRGIERVIAVLIGGVSIILGFFLFLRISAETNADGRIKLPGGTSIILTRVGPGVFFALFGAVVVGLSFYFAVKIENSDGKIIRYSGIGSDQQTQPDAGDPAHRASVLRDISVLNGIGAALRADLSEDDRASITTAIDNAKLALMTSVWSAEWGDLHEFEKWLSSGGPYAANQPAPTTPVGKAAAVYRRGEEVRR